MCGSGDGMETWGWCVDVGMYVDLGMVCRPGDGVCGPEG